MSSAPTPHSSLPPTSSLPPAPPARKEITLISHSMLFYWWPIWLLGYFMAGWTYMENHRLAILPPDVTVMEKNEDQNSKDTTVFRLAVKNPPTESLANAEKATKTPGSGDPFKTRVSQHAWMGPVFCVVLLLTLVITNVPMRGLWSLLVIMLLLLVAMVITIIPRGWDNISSALFNLHIYINMAGYLFIATAVLLLWFISVFIFDQRTYMTVEPGQIRICEHVGASIRNIDSTGVEFEKQRDDLFRHWLLGFFSGDLIIHLPDKSQVRLPNVLWIGWRLNEVQQLLREKQVTPS